MYIWPNNPGMFASLILIISKRAVYVTLNMVYTCFMFPDITAHEVRLCSAVVRH
jgi:hypothetical protein